MDSDVEDNYYSAADTEMSESDTRIYHVILNQKDIQKHQKDVIQQISTVLSISLVQSSILLLHYHWNVSKVHDEWFADEERVRRTLGILEGPKIAIPHGKELTCGICFESFLNEETVSLACGHPFCCTCLTGYISTAINDGPGCLLRKCPEPSCPAAVGQDMVEKLASKEDKERYYTYFLRSYIEDNKQMKWCPAPGCEHAIDYSAGTASYDVTCLCSHSFCWNCLEEAHSPVDCDTVERWTLEKNSASENINWILVNSKPCPKCKIPIEKNHGCVHMTCRPPCKYEFCWLCLGAWGNHSDSTGGFNDCIIYERSKQKGLYDEAEEKKKMAKKSLQRYLYYFEHWESNQTLRQRAIEDLQKMRLEKLAKLSDILRIPKSQLMFITEAWLQVIECRRVLKWTYSYGYYLRGRDKELFFEHLQGVAEKGLERLTKCVERDSEVFYNARGPSDDFNDFKKKLTGLTSTTKLYFANLVKALENGLSVKED